MKKLFGIVLTTILISCGGGGGGSVPPSQSGPGGLAPTGDFAGQIDPVQATD